MPEITFTVEALPEDQPVRGNALASGDTALDREAEDKILRELGRGNIWAWCCVKVTAHYDELHISEYLGCCSYDSEEDFVAGAYYEDLCSEAEAQLRSLATELAAKPG